MEIFQTNANSRKLPAITKKNYYDMTLKKAIRMKWPFEKLKTTTANIKAAII